MLQIERRLRRKSALWILFPWSLMVALGGLPGCVTSSTERAVPPIIDADTEVDEMLDAALEFGGDTLQAVKRQIQRRRLAAPAAQELFVRLKRQHKDASSIFLGNALHLYLAVGAPRAVELFRMLMAGDRQAEQITGWYLATAVASPAMGQAVEARIEEALLVNDDKLLLEPRMADAVAANRLVSSYTVVRQGLMSSGHASFANAMIALDGRRASTDFLDYLARASIEELRQLHLTSVDMFTCMAILEHLRRSPPPTTDARFQHLFYFAVCRNGALAQLARQVIEDRLKVAFDDLALMLASMPAWVQIAFIENSRRDLSPPMNRFLSKMARTTSHREVVEEIRAIVR